KPAVTVVERVPGACRTAAGRSRSKGLQSCPLKRRLTRWPAGRRGRRQPGRRLRARRAGPAAGGAALIVLDAGILLALLDAADPRHAAVTAALRRHAGDDVKIRLRLLRVPGRSLPPSRPGSGGSP